MKLEGDTNEILEGPVPAPHFRAGLVAEYSEWLMDLHEQQGQRDKLLAELEYHIFALSPSFQKTKFYRSTPIR